MRIADITHEIGASLHHGFLSAADQIVNVIKGSPQSSTTVPYPIRDLSSKRNMAILSVGVYTLSRNLKEVFNFSAPVAASLAFTPALLHTRHYEPNNIGLNSEKILAHGEWHRLVTGQLINATYMHLLENTNDVYESGRWLEDRWGWQGLLGAVGAVVSLAPALYGTFS